MGQRDLKRTHFKAREIVITPQNSAQQKVAKTKFFEITDVVDVVDVDINGNILSVLADNLTVLGIVKNQEIALSGTVDTSTAVGTPMLVNQSIDDGQAAIERLYEDDGESEFILTQDILDKDLNVPVAGKTKYDIADSSFWRAGDLLDIFDNTGRIATDLVIDSININADDVLNKSTVVVNAVQDVTLGNNPYILNKTINNQKATLRNQERIDEIDRPVKNEYNGVGDGAMTVVKTINLFLKDSTDYNVDGNKQRLGTQGTRASLVQGSGSDQLSFSSMILGTLGNEVEIAVVAGAGLTVAVTKIFKVTANGASFANSQYLIQVNDNGAAATAQELADAINGDAIAQRIVQAVYGGDGTGITTPFAAANLAGGLDDGIGDYAEMEQVFENSIATTGFKYLSLHIRPNERNRAPEPVADDEDMILAYSRAHDNADR